MIDLQKERRRLNLELAALTSEAYEIYQDLYGPYNLNRTPPERKALADKLKATEGLIIGKITERDLVVRAISWHMRSNWDERADEMGIDDSDAGLIGETILATDEETIESGQEIIEKAVKDFVAQDLPEIDENEPEPEAIKPRTRNKPR